MNMVSGCTIQPRHGRGQPGSLLKGGSMQDSWGPRKELCLPLVIEFGSWEPTHLRTGPETKASSLVAAQISQHFPGNAWYLDTLEKERRQASARGTHAVLSVLVSVALCHWVRRTQACLPSWPCDPAAPSALLARRASKAHSSDQPCLYQLPPTSPDPQPC